MYQEFFRLQQYPFQNTSDPAFFYEGGQQKEALARLTYGIQESKGLMLITGKVGSGKTMLARGFSSRLGPEWQVIEVNNPWITAQELFQFVLGKMTGTREGQRVRKVTLDMIHNTLLELDAKGSRILLIIDEAQLLSQETLEGMRFLHSLESDNRKLLSILMMGQEELEALLKTNSLRALQQRIRLTYALDYMTPDETDAYIQHRLKVAGGDPYLFPRECIDLVHQASHGCPRLVNNICDDTLLFAFGRSQSHITSELVREAAGVLLSEEKSQNDQSSPPAEPQGRDAVGASRDGGDREGARHHRVDARQKGRREKKINDRGQIPGKPDPGIKPVHAQAASLADRDQGMQSLHLPYDEMEEAPSRNSTLWIGLGVTVTVLGLIAWIAWAVWMDDVKPPVAATSKTAATPPTPATAQKNPVEPLPATPEASGANPLSLPRPTANHKVRIDAKTPLTLLAAEYFGAWNVTVLDILAAINPGLDLEHAPSGTVFQIPSLNRSDLIVADRQGRFFLYYASFEDEGEAQSNLQSLRMMTHQALLQSAQRGGKPIWRLYAGPYTSNESANKAANTLWFKYLPLLN